MTPDRPVHDHGAHADAPAPPVPPLRVDRATPWRPRLPGWLLPAAVVASAAVCIGASIATAEDGAVTAEMVAAPTWVVDSVVQSTVLAAVLVVFLAPAAGALLAALSALVIAASPATNAGLPGLWGGAGVLLAVLAGAELLAATRQRALAHTWRGAPDAVVLVPEVSGHLRGRLLRPRVKRVLAGAGCLVVTLGGFGLFVHDAGAAAAFRAGASVASAPVESVDEDWTAVTVTIDGREYQVPAPTTYPEEGEVVGVRYDPASGRAELTHDVFDPTLVIIPATGGLLAGVVLLAAEHRRRRRMTTLLTDGGTAHRVRATWSEPHGGAVLHADDDVTWVVGVAPDLVAESDSASDGGAGGPDGDLDPADDDVMDTPVADLSDAELLDLARSLSELEAEAAQDDATREPPGAAGSWVLTPVVVVGLTERGAPVALLDDDGDWYVTATGLAPAPGAAVAGPKRRTRRVTAGGWAGFVARRDAALERVARRSGRWAPWLAVPVVAWVLRWMSEGESLLRLLPVFGFCAAVGWSWSMFGQPARLEIGPRSLRVRGRFVDELIPWGRVRSVTADDGALVVRLGTDGTDDQDALLLAASDDALPLTRASRDPQVVAARLRDAWHAHAGVPPPRLRRRPATPAVVGAAWLTVAVAAAVSTR